MPDKMALVNYHICKADACGSGVCKAVSECPLKLISQETTFSIPMTDPFACMGCGSCVRACHEKAISIVTM
jgi:translation initiation factor RLI1